MYHRRGLIALCALFIALSSANDARSQNFSIIPSLSLEERYDSNVRFRSDSEDSDSDFISTVSPAVRASKEGIRYDIDAYYRLDADYHSQDTDLDSVSHKATLGARYELSNKTRIGLGDTYYFTKDSLRATETGILVVRTDISANTVFFNIGHQLGPKIDIGLTLRDTNLDFEEQSLVDTRTDSASLTGGYKYNPAGRASVTYKFTNFSFDSNGNKDIESHALFFSIAETVDPTLKVDLSAGVVYASGLDGGQDDYFLTATAGLEKTLRDSTIAILYSRAVTNPTGLTDEININDRLSFTLSHTLSRDISLSVTGGLAKSRTEPSGRVDMNSYDTSAQATWQAKRWMKFGAGVQHFQQWPKDNFGTGLTRNQVFVNVTFTGPEWRF
ncbi:MAG: outer membrane beta-barrel protein [Deltaproteobacteria bacterium]|nr:outer membrane beta-barrel protein [Deltaproteobacteria bacterium]